MEKIKKINIVDIFFREGYKAELLRLISVSFILELVVEILSRSSIIGGVKFLVTRPVSFLCGMLIIMTTLGVVFLVRRRVFTYAFISAVWIGLGIANCVLLNVRVTPFNASDLRLIDSAIETVDKYFSITGIVFIGVAIVAVLVLLVAIFFKSPKYKGVISYVKSGIVIGVVAILMAGTINISLELNFISHRFSNLTNAYNKYGFVYCFVNSLVNTGVKKPSNYSEKTIEKILDEIGGKGEEKVRTPNIIFLQLESFFDINQMKDITLSKDPIPTFNKLKKEYTSGYLNVYNVGYGTSNTEFEIITGMNLDDFGPGEFPYRTVLQNNTCESICYDLKKYGYKTHAIHNNEGTFYSRNLVFSNLGFDTFTSIEYMDEFEKTEIGWAKDKCLTKEIMKVLTESKEKDYIYTISVQGHGSYPTTEPESEPAITLKGIEDTGRKNAYEYYISQISEMDDFIKELTEELSGFGEEVVLVMYGDHLPGLGIGEDELINGSVYQTEYIIWNNFGMKKQNENIQAYQLASKVMGQLGIKTGVINSLHQKFSKDEEYLLMLQNLEYDILYGDMTVYDGVNPFAPTEIQMGTYPISIKKVYVKKDDEVAKVVIEGENFTTYSKVLVNGEKYDTEFIDKEHLMIDYEDIESLDSFVVAQIADDGVTLSETKECLYYGNDIRPVIE